MVKITLFFVMFFAVPGLAGAQVVVNEIAWMGSEADGVDARQEWRYEWIELYNSGDADISLNGWTIELRRENLDFVIPLHGTIKRQGYFVAGASRKIKNIDLNYGSLTGKLANDGQLMLLKDRAGNVIDEIDARTGWFAGENKAKLTMERRFPEKDSADAENWGPSLLAYGSSGAENTIFGKEAIIRLDSNPSPPVGGSGQAKKSPVWASFFEAVTHTVFILAVLLALGSAFFSVLLRRYLLRAPRE